MGRKKIKIQPIKEDRNRSVTYLKRKAGLFKKAHELAVLTDSDVAVIVFGHNGKLAEFCSSDIDRLLLRYTQYDGVVEKKGPQHYLGGDESDEDDEGGNGGGGGDADGYSGDFGGPSCEDHDDGHSGYGPSGEGGSNGKRKAETGAGLSGRGSFSGASNFKQSRADSGNRATDSLSSKHKSIPDCGLFPSGDESSQAVRSALRTAIQEKGMAKERSQAFSFYQPSESPFPESRHGIPVVNEIHPSPLLYPMNGLEDQLQRSSDLGVPGRVASIPFADTHGNLPRTNYDTDNPRTSGSSDQSAAGNLCINGQYQGRLAVNFPAASRRSSFTGPYNLQPDHSELAIAARPSTANAALRLQSSPLDTLAQPVLRDHPHHMQVMQRHRQYNQERATSLGSPSPLLTSAILEDQERAEFGARPTASFSRSVEAVMEGGSLSIPVVDGSSQLLEHLPSEPSCGPRVRPYTAENEYASYAAILPDPSCSSGTNVGTSNSSASNPASSASTPLCSSSSTHESGSVDLTAPNLQPATPFPAVHKRGSSTSTFLQGEGGYGHERLLLTSSFLPEMMLSNSSSASNLSSSESEASFSAARSEIETLVVPATHSTYHLPNSIQKSTLDKGFNHASLHGGGQVLIAGSVEEAALAMDLGSLQGAR